MYFGVFMNSDPFKQRSSYTYVNQIVFSPQLLRTECYFSEMWALVQITDIDFHKFNTVSDHRSQLPPPVINKCSKCSNE